jgi:hypothetical protein
MRKAPLYFFTLFFLCQHAYSQSWTPWQNLYSDGTIAVDISFKNSPTACDVTGKTSKYRYRIQGALKNFPSFVTWKMEYENCNGILYEEANSINIGKGGDVGIIESMDFVMNAVNVKLLQDEVSISTYEERKKISQSITKNESKWTQWQVIYTDAAINIELSFKNSPSACDAGGKTSKYRYRVQGTLKSFSSFVIWKMGYENCNGLLYEEVNSVNIGKGGDVGIIENMDFVFPSVQANPFLNEVSIGANEQRNIKQKLIVNSTLPRAIKGEKIIWKGEKTTLGIDGGTLGTDAEWKWYEDGCSAKFIGSGGSISVTPLKSTRYFLKAESPRGSSACITFDLEVREGTKMPVTISGDDYVCDGGLLRLYLEDAILGDETSWVWYEGSCKGKEIGRGDEIYVKPEKKTMYFLSAQGKYESTQCVSKEVSVSKRSQAPTAISSKPGTVICKGEEVELSLNGGSLELGGEWVWYESSCGSFKKVGRGARITVKPFSNTEFFVRAEGKCDASPCASITIKVIDEPLYPISIETSSVKVYKNKTIKLTVDSSYGYKNETEWIWIQGNCSSGKRIGQGSSIMVKCSQPTTYSVYGKNTCSNSSCISKTLYPLKKASASKYFAKGKKFHLGFSIGSDVIVVAANQASTSSSANSAVFGTGLVGGVFIHPVFTEYFSIGAGVDYSFGTFFLDEVIYQNIQKNSYSAFAPRAELAFGAKKARVLLAYRAELYSDKVEIGNQSNNNSTLLSFRRDIIGLGTRVGSYSRKPRGVNFDLTYSIIRDYEWSWKDFKWGYKTDTSWKGGLSSSLWIHSRINLYADIFFNSNTTLVEGNIFRVGIRYNRNAFY